MIGVDVGSGDRLALGVPAQYRMATTEQMHRVTAPEVRIEQTRRRLARLREEGLVDRITLPQAGRTRVWVPTSYDVWLACEWPEVRGRRPSRTVCDPTAMRLKAGHMLTVTEMAFVFLEDARRCGELCEPLDWIPEMHHPIGSGEAVIPDALLWRSRTVWSSTGAGVVGVSAAMVPATSSPGAAAGVGARLQASAGGGRRAAGGGRRVQLHRAGPAVGHALLARGGPLSGFGLGEERHLRLPRGPVQRSVRP
ncbi:replication-relaxation family protein [Streptomyces sp. NPDC005811]|uniref:replication-relaxation family protein n=1 Tax=Streptomyces sp. NPDC005811 TaxID=3154565 RepID=UPI0033D40AA3